MEASPLTEVEDALLKEGIQEFDSARYWHAHESWEDLWNSLKRREAPRSEILGIQGLIQTAALLYNHQREKKRCFEPMGENCSQIKRLDTTLGYRYSNSFGTN